MFIRSSGGSVRLWIIEHGRTISLPKSQPTEQQAVDVVLELGVRDIAFDVDRVLDLDDRLTE